MKALVQELKNLKEELDEICLLRARAREGVKAEEEKASLSRKKVSDLRRQISVATTQDPVEDILAGKNPNYNSCDEAKDLVKKQEELIRVHEETRAALNDKAIDLSSKKRNIEQKIEFCRLEIIKKVGLDLLHKTDKQLVCNLLLAIGFWSGQPSMFRALEQVPGFLSGEYWGVAYNAAVDNLLKKSGAIVVL